MTAVPTLPVGFDPTDPELNEAGVPLNEFLEMRQAAPVFWVEQPEESRAGMEGGSGYWALSSHADVAAVSKNDAEFVTSENTAIIRFGPDMTRDQLELQRVMLINQDGQEHHATRRIISRGFTPRSIMDLEPRLIERAHKIVDDALANGEGDFVEQVASELPLQAIAELLGVPQEDRRKLFQWSNEMLSYDDPEFDADPEAASIEILTYAMELAEKRKVDPQDDIMTKLVTAGEDGEMLSADQLGYFVIMLAVAGNETTRNAITHGMNAFFDNPDQWELFKKERPKTAVDEIIRWATPVTVFQRTATRDTQVGGVPVQKGQRVGLFYAAANHDPAVFTNPGEFNILRDPNPHVAFGGHGAHYCVGANLARMEVEIMFNVIADRMPEIRKLKEPRRLRSGWINGIKELQVAYK
ncbi:cytochrome P450 [Nocardioides baekrokdamisoli]|uniref:Cytochrome P450 n=1 Tax=Nocardioides baekrokdamisoli TaxID=1804624 RepID=A0A3G9J1F7_9ACTN|nr:cytochrome P450 [Nocardioides baekrokdamisoli]BBH18483.1 cytochrome P450 [Nocardioides baekrokdamisoli]